MNWQRRPRLDPDEAASLDVIQGASGFTREELNMFDAYCVRLMSLAEISGVVCSGVSLVHDCGGGCGRRVPAGIPSGWRNSPWDLCPACVRTKKMVELDSRKAGAVDRALNEYVVDEQADKRAFFNAVKRVVK